ncbi:hypothetical protein HLB03_01805, partial [Acidianus sp. DSM 29099]|nr:hypothetical protein [Acidianus sp. RZ1]
ADIRVIEEQEKRLADLIKEKEDKRNKLVNSQNELNRLKDEEVPLIANIEELENELKVLEDKRNKYFVLDNQLSLALQEKNEISAFLEKVKSLDEEIKNVDNQINQLSWVEKASAYKEELATLVKQKGEISRQINKITSEIEKVKKNLELKNKLYPKFEEYQKAKDEYDKIMQVHENYTRLSGEIKSLKTQLNRLKQQLDKLGKIEDIEVVKRKIEQLDEEVKRKREEKAKNIAEKTRLENVLKNLENAEGGKCPVCGHQLDKDHIQKLVEESTERIGDLSSNIINLEKEVKQGEKYLEELRNKLNILTKAWQIKSQYDTSQSSIEEKEKELESMEELEEKYFQLQRSLKDLEPLFNQYLSVKEVTEERLDELLRDLSSFQSNLQELEEKEKELKEKIGDEKVLQKAERDLQILKQQYSQLLNKRGEKHAKEERLNDLNQRIAELKSKISSLNYTEDYYKKVKEEHQNLDKRLRDLQNNISALEKEIEILSADIDNLSKKIDEDKKNVSKLPSLENAIKKIDKLRSDLGGTGLQNFLISALKSKIENNLTEILGKFDLAYSTVELDFDLSGRRNKSRAEIKLFNNAGQDFTVNQLSGGERVALGLALRLAIANSLMEDVGFMILDEPTVHLDDERKKELMDVIRSSMGIVPQIMVVTHDEEVRDISDYIIQVEAKGNGSRVKEVIPDDQQGL